MRDQGAICPGYGATWPETGYERSGRRLEPPDKMQMTDMPLPTPRQQIGLLLLLTFVVVVAMFG